MAPSFVPPTSFLLSIPLLLESLIAIILSIVYFALTKDKSVVYMVASTILSFTYILLDCTCVLHHAFRDTINTPSWRLIPRRRVLCHIGIVLFLAFALLMLDATNLRGIWHSDQSSEFVFNNTMVRRHVLGVRGQTDASSAGLDGDGNGKCIVGCRKKKVRRDYEGLLSAVSVFGVVLLTNHLIMCFLGCFEARARSQRRKRERIRSDEERRLRALEARVFV